MDIALQSDETLKWLLEQTFEKHGPQPAVTCLGESLSYAELGHFAHGPAVHLQQVGLEKAPAWRS
ncbi:hypothetical protein [Variovorax sp. E3]|uniref:hypothetical protein n=1 Tax=Variovorax sp. E3 TaxID=1914993 RepID=UPI0022B65149|nr:hypothetical protein [Variovorax sp. E3]